MKPMVSTPRNTIIDQKPNTPISLKASGPWKEKSDLKVEDDEQDRYEIEPHVELHAGVVEGVEPALVGGDFLRIGIADRDEKRRDHQGAADEQRNTDENRDRQIMRGKIHHRSPSASAREPERLRRRFGVNLRRSAAQLPQIRPCARFGTHLKLSTAILLSWRSDGNLSHGCNWLQSAFGPFTL